MGEPRVVFYGEVNFISYGVLVRACRSFQNLIEAANRLMINVENCWAVGDHPNDIIAAKRAGMCFIGALWGSIDKEAVKKEKPDIVFSTVETMIYYLRNL